MKAFWLKIHLFLKHSFFILCSWSPGGTACTGLKKVQGDGAGELGSFPLYDPLVHFIQSMKPFSICLHHVKFKGYPLAAKYFWLWNQSYQMSPSPFREAQ